MRSHGVELQLLNESHVNSLAYWFAVLRDDADFAYLPDGPNPSLENGSFESPAFKRLGGGWYSWTASW